MKRSSLLDLLRTFSARDRRLLREYVYSPLLNKNRKVRKLLDHLLSFAPQFEDARLNKVAVFRHIFGDENYNEFRINNIISDLLQCLYGYLAFLQYEGDVNLQKRQLLTELLDRENHDHFERNARRYDKLRQKEAARNIEYFREAHQLAELLDRYSLTKDRRGYDENLQRKNDALARFYFIDKFRIACDMASRNIVVQAGYECHFLDQLLRSYESGAFNLEFLPVLKVYYTAYQMLTGEGAEKHYQQLKKLLELNIGLFPHRELNILYRYALNFCVRQINTGRNDYYQEILDVYQLLLEKRIIFENGYLTQWSYINIIMAGIRLGVYDWTEAFIHDYKEALHPGERHNVFNYNLANFYFEKRDYPRALQQLHEVEFTDTSYHLGAKIIQLKSFFELEETEPFFSLLEAFRKYLLRNREIADYRKKANNNFLRLVRQLFQLKISRETMNDLAYQKKREEIGRRIDTLSPLANKGWLIEVFDGLGKKRR